MLHPLVPYHGLRAGTRIVTHLGGKRAGQVMGLNVFILFIGFGLGSILFGAIVPPGTGTALLIFSFVLMASALARSVPVPHRNCIDTKLSAHWSLESQFLAAVISRAQV